ncbi:MAG TPA: NUDIX hydrolase [Gemmatales bacterium]|nr:NUDIX hydrolase [Gemmatales bacterium]
MQQHGPWKIVSRRWAYEDPWMKVQRDEVIRPDGQPGTYAVVHIKPGACVLPVDEEGLVHLTEEFHYAVGKVTLECVSGGMEPGETFLTAAKRELREELGLQAEEWQDLGRLDPFTASVLSPTQLFLARKLTYEATSPDGTELIRHVKIPLSLAVQLVMQSVITHAPSMALILKANYLLNQ